jgi:hypothetical protein
VDVASPALAPDGAVRVRFEPHVSAGRTRLICRLDPRTEADYARPVARASAAIERSLGPEVVANRVDTASVARAEVRLRGWRAERSAFRRAAASAFGQGLVLRADVAACYASISPPAVRDALDACVADPRDVDACVGVLRRIAAAGVEGLPVGPAPSAVLANAVLAGADDVLRARGATFLRWVDDWFIGVRSQADAVTLLDALARALWRRGLRLNASKTRLAPAGDARPSLAEYHRAADAHAVPGLPRPHAVVPVDGGVAARR